VYVLMTLSVDHNSRFSNRFSIIGEHILTGRMVPLS